MTIDAYFNPDFTTPEKLLFLLLAFVLVLVSDLIIIGGTSISFAFSKDRKDKNLKNIRIHEELQLFYEMIISATSVMSFACAYVILNHVFSLVGPGGEGEYALFAETWSDWKDFILLLLILVSCILNTILDKLIIPLRRIEKDKVATVRMLAMFYAIILLLCLNYYGDESEYSPVMMYYLGLMVGRFVYFDASFGDFIEAIKNVFLNLPILILGLTLTGILSYVGFSAGFFLERNYYIVGVFYAHLFMLAAVFILFHTHIFDLIFRVGKKEDAKSAKKEKVKSAKKDRVKTGKKDKVKTGMKYAAEYEEEYEEEDDYVEEDDYGDEDDYGEEEEYGEEDYEEDYGEDYGKDKRR